MKSNKIIIMAAMTAVAMMPREADAQLKVGGYGEVALTRNFYSDNVYRYSDPKKYANDPSHGRFDIPHAVIYLSYDFGKGWLMSSEIEFEHTGTGCAQEKEFSEGGEWEQEIEKGGEVELEQFWIQKTFQDGAGANAIWNITNVTRSDRPKLYTTTAWADAMAETPSVIAAIKEDPTSPYFTDGTDEGISDAVRNLLSPATNQFDNPWYRFEAEMSDYNYYAFLVWHRGLSIPRARNLQDAEVQQGKKVFNEIGCATCHRPSWKTGSDNYWAPAIVGNQPLPKYPNQVIYPYSDMIQHKLAMKNDIHGSWCRTTPLWGRGLSLVNTGAEDRLHDCRARNEIEAIMWHGYSKKSHAYNAAVKFYNLSTRERNAVVKFLQSI